MNPLRLSFMPPSSMVPLHSLSQYPLNRAGWNNVFYAMTKMKALNHSKFVCRDNPSENDKLILSYRVHTCHRCLTTDNSIIKFEYNATSKYGNDSVSSFWRDSVSYSRNHGCDEEYYRKIICGLCPPELEESKKCVMMERNSGQFLLKAISSGSWIEKTKSLVALKIPPRHPDDERFHALINCQVRLSVGSTSNTNSIGSHQPSSSLVPISARINLQDIPLIEFNNSNRDIFHAAIKEGVIRLDETMSTKFCEYARESSIVMVRVNTVGSACDTKENLSPQYSPADDRMNNVDENNVDAYIEAALGRKIFLLILTPYPEQYMSSSVVLF